jgi:hypothetical protein
VAAFFAAPPPDFNAAPLYLDALFEFEPSMAVCFPEGPETARRRQIAERRIQPVDKAYQAFVKDPTSISGEAFDRLVADLEEGMRKLEKAQRRPGCVFQTGLSSSSPLPHAEAARRVARIVVLRTHRNLARGDVEEPLHDLAIVLRLTRDLRPRGPMICQLIATAMSQICTVYVIPPLLASPKFREQHIHRLLELLVQHEARSIDGYQDGVKSEYLILRQFLADTEKDPRRALDFNNNRTGEPVGDRDARTDAVVAAIKATTSSAIARVNARVDGYFRDLLAFKDKPVSQWPQKFLDPTRIHDASVYSKVATITILPAPTFAQSEARAKVVVRAAECLTALRLWRDRMHTVPADLVTVVNAAGLPGIPIDPYSGQPLRMAIIDGEPVVYSVGKDGRDDGGRFDSDSDRKPGDQTFRLSEVEKKRER